MAESQLQKTRGEMETLLNERRELQEHILDLKKHLNDIDEALAAAEADSEAGNTMERRRERVEEWLRRAVAMNREAEASRAKVTALSTEKEQLQRYLDTELPQLQKRLAETTQEITQLYTGKEMAETQLSEKTQTVDRYAHLMSELSNRVLVFLGEKSGL
jgi:chromosome segregation ATPase